MKKIISVATALLVAAGCTALGSRQFGQAPRGDDLAKISISRNHDGETFRNSHEIAAPTKEFSFWAVTRAWLFERAARAPKTPIEVRKLDLAGGPASDTRVSWMGHSTILVEMDGKRILLDPVFPIMPPPIAGCRQKASMRKCRQRRKAWAVLMRW